MLSDLGSQVTILEALPKILPGCDKDVTDVVLRSFKKRGIDVRTGRHGVRPRSRRRTGRRRSCAFGDGEEVKVEAVVVSVGRRPLSDHLGLDGTAVQVDERGFVVVDEYMRTAEPGVFAAGDVVATPGAGPRRLRRGRPRSSTRSSRSDDVVPVDYGKVPWCIYCHPEVAFAGLSEEAATGGGLRGGHQEGSLRRQRAGPDHRGARGRGQGHLREDVRRQGRADPRRAHGRAVGDRAARARATWRSTGRRPPTRSPTTSSPTPRCRRRSARPCSP